MLLGNFRYWRVVSLAQELRHLLFAEPGLLHGLLTCLQEPSSQELRGPKTAGQVKGIEGFLARVRTALRQTARWIFQARDVTPNRTCEQNCGENGL